MESLISQPEANRNSPKSDRLVADRSSQRLGPPAGWTLILNAQRNSNNNNNNNNNTTKQNINNNNFAWSQFPKIGSA